MNPVIYPDSESWLQARRLGASDVAAALGYDPWCSPYTLWARKTGRIEQETSLPMRVGHHMEGLIDDLYQEHPWGYPTDDPGDFAIWTHTDYPWLTCTPDRVVVCDGDIERIERVVEIKSIGDGMARTLQNVEPPMRYRLQLQAQLEIMNCEHGDLACLIGNHDFEIHTYRRDRELWAAALPHLRYFWECVQNDTAPKIDGSDNTLRTVKAMYPDDNGETVTLSEDATLLALDVMRIKSEIKALDVRRREAEAQLLAVIGDATFGESEQVRVSCKTQSRLGNLTVPLDKREELMNAGIAYKESKGSTYRALRVNERKSA